MRNEFRAFLNTPVATVTLTYAIGKPVSAPGLLLEKPLQPITRSKPGEQRSVSAEDLCVLLLEGPGM
jgi:hypothetical protein